MNTRFAIILLSTIICFAMQVQAQQLKPTEIIYSRLPNDINAPPTGTNQPTIWVVGQDGSNDRFITFGTAPRISDDGRFLLFKRFTRHPAFFYPFGGYADFVVRELATGQETVIISTNFDQGSFGHFFSPESNQGNYEIIADDSCLMYKFNRNGSGLTFLYPTTFPAYCADDFPVLRRGGDQLIAFHNLSTDTVNGGGLFTVGIGGAGRQKVPNTNCGDFDAAWSNDNQFIAFGSLFQACSANFPQDAYPYFVSNLYKIKPDGTGRQQLTNLANTNCRDAAGNCLTFGMVWTDDNSKIIAAGRINNVKGLFAFNTNGTGAFSQIPISAGNPPDFVGGIVQPRVERQVVSIGGGVATNGSYTLVSTIGEAIAGQTSFGGSYNLESGFWAISSPKITSFFDFDGDSKTDVGIFRPGPGEWWYLRSTDGGNRAFQFGQSTDKMVPADYTGDGKTDVGFYRPSTGEWYILRSEDGSFYAFPFGNATDIPTPADFDGDGRSDPAIYRPSNSTWYILRSSDGGTTIAQFGANGDLPVAADYDGDGKADLAIFRPSNGSWWLNRTQAGLIVLNFGTSTDKTVQADYTGDGKADVAFFRPSTREWFVSRSEDFSFYSAPFGAAGDIPTPGDYDGDGRSDLAIFRPSNNTWFLLRSTSGFTAITFGAANDIPIPSAYVR